MTTARSAAGLLTASCALLLVLIAAGCTSAGHPRGLRASPTTVVPAQATTVPAGTATTTTVESAVATCDPSRLTARAGHGSGAGGHLAIVVTFTNHSAAPCTMYGYPTAWLIEVGGAQVGPSIDERGAAQPGLVTVRPQGEASTTVWYDNPAVPYPPCPKTNVEAIRLVPPGQSGSLAVPMTFNVCRSPAPVVGTTPIGTGSSESTF